MQTPYGLPILDGCVSCSCITPHGFCDLPASSRQKWERERRNASYGRGTVLFVEKQHAQEIAIICIGQVKLYSTAPDGTVAIHRLCSAGDVLGLHETLLGGNYMTTAETIAPCVINHLKGDVLNRLIRNDAEIAIRVARHLSRQLLEAQGQVQDQRFCNAAISKVARFLMASAHEYNRISLCLTHEEIGEVIGLARETVTRSIKELKSRNVIRVAGHLVTILDPAQLARLSARA